MRFLERLPRVFKLTTFSLLLCSAAFFLSQFTLSDYFPIRTVRVYGVDRLDQKEIQQALLPLLSHGFFTINVERIRDRLKQMSFVSELNVRRVWPDQVVIELAEKKPAARWNESQLLSENGEVFSPEGGSTPSGLPAFAGPDGQQVLMLKYYDSMNRLLQPLHLNITTLELTPFLTFRVLLDNGMTLQIEHKDSLTRLQQFVKVYPKIIGTRANDVDCIDLRYPNGIAVRWKQTG